MDDGARKSGDLWSGVALASLGVYVVFQARGWDYLGQDGPGAGFFPMWYGIAIITLSLALIASNLKRTVSIGSGLWRGSGRALSTWLALVGAVALCSTIGFITSFALLCFFVGAVLYQRRFVSSAIAAVSSAAGLYLVFSVLLGMKLPAGPLGF